MADKHLCSDAAPLGMGRPDYDERHEARADRLYARADKAAAESESADAGVRAISSAIPLGQPILVGHHSEKRHRNAIAKMDRGTRKAIERDRDAKHLRDRAEAAESNTAISSDDPDAIERLRAKLAQMAEQRDAYKAHNRKARKEGDATLPAYVLSNHSANMRRVSKRIETLQATAARTARETTIGKWHALENGDVNRCQLRKADDERATPDERRTLKSHGFRWAPSEGAWQRKISNGAWHNATYVLAGFSGK